MASSERRADLPSGIGGGSAPLLYDEERQLLKELWRVSPRAGNPQPGDVANLALLLRYGCDVSVIGPLNDALASRLLGAYQLLQSRLRLVIDNYNLLVEYRTLSSLNVAGDPVGLILPSAVKGLREASVLGGPSVVRFEVGQLDREVRRIQGAVSELEDRVVRASPEEKATLGRELVTAYGQELFLPWRLPQLTVGRLERLLGSPR